MLRQRYVGLLACAMLPLLGGCVQATRHSNTMVFGTNTTVGVKVGRDVHQMPSVLIAYDRQEAVIMPLLANTSERPDSQNMLSPCAPATQTVIETTSAKGTTKTTQTMDGAISFGDDNTASIHPCKFVGVRAAGDSLLIQDSYSVLASFGANLKGSARGDDATAGLAQYFATGVAAQTLAMTGGASIVSVGEGAKASAENSAGPAAAAAALGAPSALSEIQRQILRDPQIAEDADTITRLVVRKILATDQGQLDARLMAFDASLKTATGVSLGLQIYCSGQTREKCAAAVKDQAFLYHPALRGKADQVIAVTQNWSTP